MWHWQIVRSCIVTSSYLITSGLYVRYAIESYSSQSGSIYCFWNLQLLCNSSLFICSVYPQYAIHWNNYTLGLEYIPASIIPLANPSVGINNSPGIYLRIYMVYCVDCIIYHSFSMTRLHVDRSVPPQDQGRESSTDVSDAVIHLLADALSL